MVENRDAGVSIVIPVFNRLAFTRQCLDRIARHTSGVAHEVIVVDNGSTDGTRAFLSRLAETTGLVYLRNDANLGFARANNLGARAARGAHLLFLNNDTLVTPGWLTAMMALQQSDPRIGIVGIKQLFPYTRAVYHSGIVFTRGLRPIHLYPYADGDASHVNKQREYQAVNGACMLIGASLFAACGGFDEEYRNGYEDVDLCLAVRQRGFQVMCCTDAFIYHYAQITEGRTNDDERNLSRLISKWRDAVRVDEDDYFRRDGPDIARSGGRRGVPEPDRVQASDRGTSSPHWRGTRVSVVVPAGARCERLRAQLEALARQTVLAEEFEALVLDYGAGEAQQVAEDEFPYAVHYHRCQEALRAGAARNAGVSRARGELILFLGDDWVPDDRLLEEHLLAHARDPDPRTAVAGRLAWSGGAAGQALVLEVCGPTVAVLASAVAPGSAVPDVARLDLANASFKRAFLTDASASGIRIDPTLALTSFQGADLAIRLEPRGLRVHDAPDACAYREPPESFERLLSQECEAGCDAVRLSRAHPDLAHLLDVTWIGSSEEGARRLAAQPRAREALDDVVERTCELVPVLVRSLDELIRVERDAPSQAAAVGIADQPLLEAARRAVGLARDVRRTKGKVRYWYDQVSDRDAARAAETLAAAARTIDWLAANAVAAPAPHAALLETRAEGLTRRPGSREIACAAPSRAGAIRRTVIIAASRTGLKSRLRTVDAFIEARLSQRKNGWLLARYVELRARLKPFFA